MKAMVLHERGGALRFEEVPRPQVGPGEALVRVRACGAGLTVVHIKQGRIGNVAFPYYRA
jgi:D-arabinose 1-dehydrogenase-like Zn-dependent alcohol dehydrogenase